MRRFFFAFNLQDLQAKKTTKFIGGFFKYGGEGGI